MTSRVHESRSTIVLRTLAVLLTLAMLTACGEEAGSEAGASSAAPEASGTSESGPAAVSAGEARDAGALDYADICAAVDVEALAEIVGGSPTRVEFRDRSMMDSRVGDCRIFLGDNAFLEVSVWGSADDRFVIDRGGGETAPLAAEERARTIDAAGADRAVALWANEDFDSEFNNIRALVVDYDGRALNVSHGGLGPYRSPGTLLAVAERARLALGW